MRRYRAATFSVLAALVLCCQPATVAAQWSSCSSVPYYPAYYPCHSPCWIPTHCHPYFWLTARLTNTSGKFPYDGKTPVPIPTRITVTNCTCYPWSYKNSEYDFYLSDHDGNIIPNGIIRTADLRTINVPPCGTIHDMPKISLNTPLPSIQEGKTYAVNVVLRGRYSYFWVTPFLEKKK